MRILALETSAKAVSAAVTEDGKVLCSGYQDTGLTHSRTLMPIVEAMLKNTGLTVQDCDAVAVAAGPGSFTGIRIGVSAAKGLAFAADKPCAAVSTLEAMARNVAHMDALVVCAMDAIVEPVSLYEPVYSDGGDAICVMDQVSDTRNTDEAWTDRIALKEAMKRLDDRERRILSLRFYEGKTQMEVSAEVGISQAQVSRLEKGAINTIKKNI